MAQWSGPYKDISPLGTAFDDGGSIMLGQSAGGGVSHMDRMSAWRFITPTSAMTEGIIVGGRGARTANEEDFKEPTVDLPSSYGRRPRHNDGAGRARFAPVWRGAGTGRRFPS